MSHDEHDHPAAAYYASAGAPAITKDLAALGVLAFVTAAIATVCTCVVALVLPRAARIRAGGGVDAVDWSLGVYYAATALALVGLVAGFVTGSMWLHRARKNAEVLAPDGRHSPSRGLGLGRVGDPVRGAVVPVPGGARRSQGTLADGDLGPDRLLVGAVPGLRDRRPDLAQPPGRRPRAPENAAAARQWSVITAAVMVAALAGWGQVLRAITLEQHERMYG